MAEAPAPSNDAPAPDSDVQVQIQLGPHDIYPDVAATEPPAAEPTEDDEAPEPDDEAPTPPVPADAGVVASVAEQQPGTKRSRRQAGEEAYQRGLSEGRAKAQQEWQQQQHQQLLQQQQLEANKRVESLFQQLSSPTFQAREEAGKALAAIHQQTIEGNQALALARQQVHQQMAADFATVKNLPNATEADMQELLSSSSMSEFATRVHAIGQRSEAALKAQITKLEAELQAVRTHMVGSRATPEAANGAGRIGALAMHDLQGMSLKDIRKLEGTPEYDRMVGQFLADKTAGRI